MLAERRDFTVATYSSRRGTGARLTVCVLTGRAGGAEALTSVLPHPEVVRITRPNSPMDRISPNFLNLIIALDPSLLDPSVVVEMRSRIMRIQYVYREVRNRLIHARSGSFYTVSWISLCQDEASGARACWNPKPMQVPIADLLLSRWLLLLPKNIL